MRKLLPLAVALSALALVYAIAGAAPGVGGVGPEAAEKRCPRGFVHAVIAGRHRCLKRGQPCARRHDRQYHRYGFHCHTGRLTPRRQALPKPPPPPPTDTTAPETVITSRPSGLTNATTAEFMFSADEPGASFACSLDGAEPADCTSPQSYGGLAGGPHKFEVRATDQAENQDATPAIYSWTVDLTAPETTIGSGPRDPTAATSASFAFSSEPGTSFECSLDAVAFAACSPPADYSVLPLGAHTVQVRAVDGAGNVDATPATHTWAVVAGILMAAGDIACKPGATVTPTACRQQQTSDLLMNEPELTNVLALGDLQYEDGCYSEFTGPGAYHDTWGRKKAITNPVAGNHEYHDPTPCLPVASGYFQYFGSAAGDPAKGYYSFDLGPWHLIALNSEISHTLMSPQVTWLKQDLAATTKPCTLAYWHKPRFSSGGHGGSANRAPLWDALYDAGADLVLTSHDHDYERFAPQNKSGQADAARGMTQFVVGTGGASHGPFRTTIQPNSEVRDATTFGVLKLTLHASSYDWQFVPEAGGSFTDSGSAACH